MHRPRRAAQAHRRKLHRRRPRRADRRQTCHRYPAMLQKLLPVLGQMNRPASSETAALLHALRPFLKPERRDKVERAAQLARLIHLAKTFLLSQEG